MNTKKKITSILKKSNTLPELFYYYLKKSPYKKILYKKINNDWVGMNYTEISENIRKIICYLKKINFKKGDRAFLLSSNRIEWVEFDLAIMTLGGIIVPSYVTNNLSDNQFIINDCKPQLLIIENSDVFKKNKILLKNIQKKKIIVIDNYYNFVSHKKITSYKIEKYNIPKIKKSDICTIVYTSGTGGTPKGVVLSHASIFHNLEGALEIIQDFGFNQHRFLSFLPLSHSYERMAGLYFPILISAKIFFCSSMDKFIYEIKETKPTIVSAVPRLYENIYKKIKSEISKSNLLVSYFLKNVFFLNENYNNKKNILKKILNKLFVFLVLEKKIKANFGGKIQAFISGGAALNPVIGNFFLNLGFCLLQGYGQTEASPLISCNTKLNNDPKTVGLPIKNVKIKFSSENEILVKGKNVMIGYWNNPKLTKSTLKKSWLHTGDLGFFDKEGRIIINGRKKDLIVTSGGDNISTQKIENFLLSYNEIQQVLIFGDNKPYLIALIVPSEKTDLKFLNTLINKVNARLNRIEKIRKILLIEEPFTYENGFLTQTQKIKKKKVFDFYREKINRLYQTL